MMLILKKKIDFLKIDVQGFESVIIDNSPKTLSGCLAVQLELSPVPLYKNEKTFSYVCNQMENLKFNLNMFSNINTKTFKPMVLGGNSLNGLNTIFQLDCVFIPKYETLRNFDIEQIKKLILIMHYCYNSFDFVDYLIRELDRLQNSKIINDYREFIKTVKIKKKY